MKKVICLTIGIIALLAASSQVSGKIIYVDDDAPVSSVEDGNGGANNGSNWENAYVYLQDALADAESFDGSVEIRIAQGIYRPDQGANKTPGDREATFNLIEGISLIGGYAGITESDPNVRDIDLYETILSGDLDGNDVDVNTPGELKSEPTRSENSFHVIKCYNIDLTVTLDGLTISDGNANSSSSNRYGAGMYNSQSSVILINCTFKANSAAYDGGGIYNYYGNITLTNCTFSDNQTHDQGGGIYNYNSNLTLTNCLFNDNQSNSQGGGLYDGYLSNSSLENCTFSGNSTSLGGGIFTYYSNPVINNCIFENNDSQSSGGGIGSYNSEAIITNCVFTENISSYGGGIYIRGDIKLSDCQLTGNSASRGGGAYNDSGSPVLTNCEFVGNYASSIGGGLASNDQASPKLSGCTFIANLSDGNGGALEGNYSIYNSIISGNVAAEAGGAIYGYGETVNCTIVGNKAQEDGGGIYIQGIATLTNNIIRDNKALSGNEIYAGTLYGQGRGVLYAVGPSVVDLKFNNIKSGEEEIFVETDSIITWGTGNINNDPCFYNPGYWADIDDINIVAEPDDLDALWIEGDYHLKSEAGRFEPLFHSWTIDDVTSICIDAGDPNTLMYDEPMPNGSRINMGAYGGTVQASMSPYDVNYFQQAFSPYPADDVIDVILDPILSWQFDANAVAHEVYFGSDNPPPFARKEYETEFDPGALEPNTQYFWRIDNLDNMVNRVAGNIWTFLTGPQPFYAYNPNPINGKDNVEYGIILSWNPGQNALLHNVYFGTNFDNVHNATAYNSLGTLVSFAQDANYYNPGKLEFDQTYYWRIEEINNDGIVSANNTWTFQTGSFPVKAYNPKPFNGAIEVPYYETILSWSPGKNAVTHDLYFGTNFDNVSNATTENNLGVLASQEQDSNSYEVDYLGYNTIYYWRVDETDSNGIRTTGDIWLFITDARPKGRACFTGRTPIWIGGTTVAISEAAAGQKINCLADNNKIEEIQEHQGTFDLYDITLETGNCITVADEHYFMTDSGRWISSKNLTTQMKLKTAKGPIGIRSVTKRPLPYTGKVYNLKIQGSDKYMVGEDAVIVRDY